MKAIDFRGPPLVQCTVMKGMWGGLRNSSGLEMLAPLWPCTPAPAALDNQAAD